jgi:hypothetical protein
LPENLEENSQQKLMGLCGDFTYALSEYVDGRGPGSRYHILLKPHFKVLKQRIEATRPKVQAHEISGRIKGIYPIDDELTGLQVSPCKESRY